jgi:predicted flavoprotein YhiN
LFCDTSAEEIIAMLVAECDRAGVQWRRPVAVRSVARVPQGFQLETDAGPIEARRLVVATGGLPVPQDRCHGLGADFGETIRFDRG